MNENLNRFQRYEAKRADQRNATQISRADAVATRDKRRETWASPHRGQPSGLLLDQKTLALRASLLNDRSKVEPTATAVPESTVTAIIETWLHRNPNYYNSDFNGVSMNNFLAKAWHEKGVTPSIELLDSAFTWLNANGHLENDPRIPRRRGDVTRTACPSIFQYETPQQSAERELNEANDATEKRQREDAENRSLSFEELKRKAHEGRGVISRASILTFQG